MSHTTNENAAPGVALPWRCFHCDEVFVDAESARVHFGTSLAHEPGCQIDLTKFREMERRVERCDAEDSDVHREMYGMQARHQQALRREEEKGYARGLTAGIQEAANATWIDVIRRLPIEGQSVSFVVASTDPHMNGRVLGGTFVTLGKYPTFSTPGVGYSASHWMPALPAPSSTQEPACNASK